MDIGILLRQQVLDKSPMAMLSGKLELETIAGTQWGPPTLSYFYLGTPLSLQNRHLGHMPSQLHGDVQ